MASDDTEKTKISEMPAQGVPTGTQIIGTYEITDLIAAGGMGEVYRGINIHTNQSVAIKIVLADLAEDETILSLFQREATILGDLNHDAIVRYHIFTKDPVLKRACLVMEFVEGRPLADILSEAPLSERDVHALLTRLAPGLQKAHDLGVVHRDLSPDNVIVQDGMISHAKIIDFGIAKSGTETKHGKTVLGDRFAGKYNYVSPEQLFLYKGIVTGKSDIYSLGLVAVAALQGRALDMGENIPEAMDKRSGVPDLSGVPAGMRPLLAWMLQPDPANRPESMAHLAAALQDRGLVPVFEAQDGGGGDAARAPAPPPQPSLPVTSQPPTGWDFDTPAPPPSSQPPLSVPPQSLPPGAVSIPPQDAFGQGRAPNPDATQIALPGSLPSAASMPPQTMPPAPGNDLPPSARSDEDSPFGGAPAPAQTSVPPQSAPQPEKRKSSALVPILAVLLLAGGGGGAYMAGLFDGAAPVEEVAAVAPPAQPTARPPAPEPEPTPAAPVPEPQPEPEPEPQTPPVQPSIAAVGTQVLQGAVFEPAPAPAQGCGEDDLECIARMVNWLEEYDLPSCTHLDIVSATARSIDLEGFGTSATPFIRLLTDFQGAHGIEPDIGVRLVDERQCPAVSFLSEMTGSEAIQPRLILDKDVLEYGGAIAGTIRDAGDRTLWLILVDHRGRFYNLTSLVSEQPNGEYRFGIQLSGGSENAPPTPQMMMVVASDRPLETVNTTTNRIADITQLVRAEVNQKGIAAGVTAAYFRFENQ